MTTRGKCLLLLIVTALLWSMSGVLVKSIDWNPLAIASSRSLVSALTIAILAGREMSWSRPGRPQIIGAFFMGLVSICFVSSTKLTTAANAILLQFTAPIWVALIAPLVLKERTRGQDWFFIALTFGGLAMFFLDSLSPAGFWGIILGLLCGLFFACMVMSLRYVQGRQPFQVVVYGHLFTALAGLMFWRPPWPALGDVGLIIFAGVVQLDLSYYLFTLASEGVTSLEMVVVTALEPILNPVWVFLVVGERPGPWALTGGVIVVVVVTVWTALKSIQSHPRPPAAGEITQVPHEKD